jgi:hypothetical protein
MRFNLKEGVLPALKAWGSLSAILGLADGKAMQKWACWYQTHLYAFAFNKVGSFKIMLITITRACVHFYCVYSKAKTALYTSGKSRFLI